MPNGAPGPGLRFNPTLGAWELQSKSIAAQTSAPMVPAIGDLWVDTSVSPPALKILVSVDPAVWGDVGGSGGGTPDPSAAWPIGVVFVSVVNTNPATLLGFGTWVQIAGGRVLVGQVGSDPDFDVAEEVGGEKAHILTVAEMPAHVHRQRRHATTTGALSGPTTAPDTSSSNPQDWGAVDTGAAGGGGAHNNMPPYLVAFIWKRTA